MRLALVAVVLAAVAAVPAHAQDVTRLPLGATFEEIVAGPDGSVWTRTSRSVFDVSFGHAGPDGVYRETHARGRVVGMAIGPDGNAWVSRAPRTLYRVDTNGALGRVGALPEAGGGVGITFATGPDGTAWFPNSNDGSIAHMDRRGVVSFSQLGAPPCAESFLSLQAMARASDGAMWFADFPCRRLLRATAAGVSAYPVGDDIPSDLTADAAGGVWFGTLHELVHVDAAGVQTRVVVPEPDTFVVDLAVAPDNVLWFATARCRVGRVAAGGAVTFTDAPIPAEQLAFTPDGTLWLAGGSRLVRGLAASAPCDEEGPRARVTPARQISLAALGRTGVRFTVREPAALSLYVPRFDEGPDTLRRTLVYRPSRKAMASLRRSLGRRPATAFSYILEARDRNGNAYHTEGTLRVTR